RDCRCGEDTEAGGVALDRVEHKRRTFRQAGRDFRDAADLAHRIGAIDPAQRAELIHPVDEIAQIRVRLPGHLFPLLRVSWPGRATAVHMRASCLPDAREISVSFVHVARGAIIDWRMFLSANRYPLRRNMRSWEGT